MRLTPPKMITFWIAVILGVLGLIGEVFNLSFFDTYSFWFAFLGLALLVAGLLVKGL